MEYKFSKMDGFILLFNLLFFFIGGIIAYNLQTSSEIKFAQPDVIREMSITSITVSSILLATILAIAAITITKSHQISEMHISISILPIAGIMTGFFSEYYSYFNSTFETARSLLGISMICTIVTMSILFSFFAWRPKTLFGVNYSEKQ